MTPRTRPSGMLAFIIVWIGQAVSMFGSAMTWFAFTIWAWQITGQATTLALVSFFSFGPTLLLSPVAGALVDRWNRKLVMMLGDLAIGLGTVAVLLLYVTDNLQIWHIYVIAVLAGPFQALQFPAYSAAVTMMLPKEQFARAEGMIGLVEAASGVLAPASAAVLLGSIGFAGIMFIDIATLVLAIGTLLLVHIPQPAATEAGRKGQGSIWKESVYGLCYIFECPSMLALQLFFAAGNFFESLGFTLMAPMILARTGDNEIVLGSVQSAGAIGGVMGGLLLIIWGGPKRRIHGVLIGWALANLLGMSLMGLGYSLAIWALASFFADFFTPIVDGSDQAIWQAKVAPDVQGRVFATRLLLSQITIPIAALLAGPLADHVFEPAMMPGGHLATTFGWLTGIGPGAGMSLILVFAGFVGVLINLAGYAFYVVRNAEDILPDHDGAVTSPAGALA
jgi:DHA3 family macrolide efflux protein-like MFS transporter